MRRVLKVSLLAVVAMLMTTGAASAASAPFAPTDSGSAYIGNGVVSLNSTGQADGTSYESPFIDVAVQNGNTVSFEYQGECGGGAPRVFIQGGAYNTFDAQPNPTGHPEYACGYDTNGDGWFTVTGVISGATPGPAGYVGIVNDNVNDDGRTILVRNLVIAGVPVPLGVDAPTSADQCKKGGWQNYGTTFKNQGDCVSFVATGGRH
jgi:hypothetical protein